MHHGDADTVYEHTSAHVIWHDIVATVSLHLYFGNNNDNDIVIVVVATKK